MHAVRIVEEFMHQYLKLMIFSWHMVAAVWIMQHNINDELPNISPAVPNPTPILDPRHISLQGSDSVRQAVVEVNCEAHQMNSLRCCIYYSTIIFVSSTIVPCSHGPSNDMNFNGLLMQGWNWQISTHKKSLSDNNQITFLYIQLCYTIYDILDHISANSRIFPTTLEVSQFLEDNTPRQQPIESTHEFSVNQVVNPDLYTNLLGCDLDLQCTDVDLWLHEVYVYRDCPCADLHLSLECWCWLLMLRLSMHTQRRRSVRLDKILKWFRVGVSWSSSLIISLIYTVWH